MELAIVIFLLCVKDSIQQSPDLDQQWDEFKARHNKTFKSRSMELRRRLNWENNLRHIIQHNSDAALGVHTYTLRDNHLADLDVLQYRKNMIKLKQSRKRRVEKVTVFRAAEHPDIPDQFNWTEKGFVTPDWNQGKCGSCYVFSVVSSIEGQYFIKTGRFLDLSEQQVLDCSITEGNFGCNGGALSKTMRYIQKAGLMSASDYPYTGKVGVCRYKKSRVLVNITSWAVLAPQDEHTMKVAVAKIGPIAASINAGLLSFQLYHSGVYNDERCSPDKLNHAILVTGYTKDAWIIKNWWSKKWGDHGYMKLARGKNRCGISNYAVYAIL